MSAPQVPVSPAPTTPGSGLNIAAFRDGASNSYQLILLTDQNQNPINGDGYGALLTNMSTALQQNIDSILTYPRGTNLSAAGTMSSAQAALVGPGKLVGLFIASITGASPSITVYDNASAASGSQIVPTFIPQSSQVGTVLNLPYVRVTNGLWVVPVQCTVAAYIDPTTS